MLNKYRSWFYVLSVLFSSTSSSMYIIALSWILYETSGNAFYSGLMVGIGFIPGLLLNLFSGVIIDRLNQKLITVLCLSINSLVILFLTLFISTNSLAVWTIITFHVMLQLMSSIIKPAMQALIVQIFSKKEYTKVIGISASLGELGWIFGVSATGFLLIFLEEVYVFLIILIISLLSLLSLSFVKSINNNSMQLEQEKNSVLFDLKDGYNYLLKNKTILGLFGIGFVGQLVLHSNTGLLSVYTKSHLDKPSHIFGLLEAVLSSGAIIAGLVTSWVFLKTKSLLPTISIFIIILGISFLSFSKVIIFSFLGIFFLGFGTTLLRVITQSIQQIITDSLYHGRMASYRMIINQGSVVIGSPVLGLISETYGANYAYMVLLIPTFFSLVYSIVFLKQKSTQNVISSVLTR
ncbi:MFS transporter [Bacillus paralicheniformis]|uniref:MFS transporter n=1 Tax=Bacillus paralicheniformis TaxID=1648923 RepID=UPI0024C1739C|nr:MFS transporter [Bacillus paralicheniformis]WHX86986.1 MFS transporter [Bacillus paralicheniformis]